jgi:long-chain acyl-CoA synthetase
MKKEVSKNIANVIAAERADREKYAEHLQNILPSFIGQTFTRVLFNQSYRWRNQSALIYGDRSFSYEQMRLIILRIRTSLNSKKVSPGTRVALIGMNSDVYVIWYLALLAHGAIAVPLNNRLVAAELRYILTHAEVTHAVVESEFIELIKQASDFHDSSNSIIEISRDNLLMGVSDQEYGESDPVINDKAIAAIYYTSGTTGHPKGVLHTHLTLIADAFQSLKSWEYDFENCRSLAVTPLFHIASHTIFLPVLFNGGCLVIDNYNTQLTLNLIQKHNINTFFAVPSVLLLLVEKAQQQAIVLNDVRVLMFGAAPMTISKLTAVQALFPNASLVHGMGQTESGGTLVTLPGKVALERAGSVGMSMPGVEVAIFDENDSQVPSGTVGELVARGCNVMIGYLKDPQATATTLRNNWLHTGDLGWMSEDGLVTLVDRKKDMIIRGGENIYSSEVEQALLKHPAIYSAAVVGIPDNLFGEQVGAYLVLNEGAAPPSKNDIQTHCKNLLADYKIPTAIKYLKELPHTATGKIKKGELRHQVSEIKWE